MGQPFSSRAPRDAFALPSSPLFGRRPPCDFETARDLGGAKGVGVDGRRIWYHFERAARCSRAGNAADQVGRGHGWARDRPRFLYKSGYQVTRGLKVCCGKDLEWRHRVNVLSLITLRPQTWMLPVHPSNGPSQSPTATVRACPLAESLASSSTLYFPFRPLPGLEGSPLRSNNAVGTELTFAVRCLLASGGEGLFRCDLLGADGGVWRVVSREFEDFRADVSPLEDGPGREVPEDVRGWESWGRSKVAR